MTQQQDFSPAQVEQLIEIANSNNQVAWIIGDDDVQAFYKSFHDKYADRIQEEVAAELRKIVSGSEPMPDDDDVPL